MSGIPSHPGSDGPLASIDLVKVVAAQCIVWHHLVLYGPLSRAARPQAEGLFGWLERDGRIAVYVFLVIGGFLSASALMPHPSRSRGAGDLAALLAQIWARYRRLAPTYLVALGCALAAASFARRWMSDGDTPGVPTIADVLAHVVLLHSLLDIPALSAGVWYVAADLLLFALLAAIAWTGRLVSSWIGPGPGETVIVASVVMLTLVGWGVCSRIETLDDWPIYFFGAYGLGIVARWSRPGPLDQASCRDEAVDTDRWSWIATVLALGAIAVWPETRPQAFVAVAVALLLAGWPRAVPAQDGPASLPRLKRSALRWLSAASQRSYALFLIHYPVSLVAGALFAQWLGSQGPGSSAGESVSAVALAGLIVTWLACNVAAELLYRLVEGLRLARRSPVVADFRGRSRSF